VRLTFHSFNAAATAAATAAAAALQELLLKHVPYSKLQQQYELVASSSTAVQQAWQVSV
jgi:hypothetical protein